MKPSVLVMVATYNGEQYLREQLDSILAQKDVDVTIKLSDDRSKDNTKDILEEYKAKYPNFSYHINEKNKNFTYNFIDMLFSENEKEYDYYAFSDQDDFWLDNKLAEAIKKISENKSRNENGCLYCSNLKLVNENLEYYGMQENEKVLKSPHYSFLVSNLATGCTIVFDNKFYHHVLRYYPENIYLHDYWLFLIAVYTASYIYDINGYILYRQHEGNQIGSNKGFFKKDKIKNFLHPKHKTSDLVKEFYKKYQDYIYPEDKKYIEIAADYNLSFKNKMKLLFSCKIRRRSLNLLFKVKVILKKY